jgi:hypothetical protein
MPPHEAHAQCTLTAQMLSCVSGVILESDESWKRIGPVPHSQPLDPSLKKFVAFLSQIPPRGPFLPVVPVRKHCAVYNLRFPLLHGMEEVIGSIPIRSTN